MKKLLILLACLILAASSCGESESIGIIGGADGPTAIIVGSGDNDSTALDEMPDIEGIPTPPGTFESGSESYTDNCRLIYIKTVDVGEDEADVYLNALIAAGFMETQSSDSSENSDTVTYALSKDNMNVLLSCGGGTLVLSVTEK